MVKQAGRRVHVCVCIPSTWEAWRRNMGKSLALMFLRCGLEKPVGVADFKLTLQTIDGSTPHAARELLTKKALEDSTVTHILWVDSDMVFPPDTLLRLLKHEKAFVAANCTTRVDPIQPVAFDVDGYRVDSRGKHGLQEVSRVGLAMALVETRNILPLIPPLFLPDWIPTNQGYCGEDIYFTQKLAEQGVRLYIDHDLSRFIYHEGARMCGHEHVEELLDGPPKHKEVA